MEFSPSLISHQASVDVKQYLLTYLRVQRLTDLEKFPAQPSENEAPAVVTGVSTG